MAKTSRRQLRGEELRKRIEVVINEMYGECRRTGKKYVYNATKVADSVPTTRKTLLKHDDLVEAVLSDLESRRRMVTGESTAEFLRDQIDLLKEKLKEKDRVIEGLINHHLAIFETLHFNSITGKELIRPILESESEEAGECILCGPSHTSKRTKVVNLKDMKHG